MTPPQPTGPARCARCGETAVTFDRETGLHLCGEHFCEDLEARVLATIRGHNLIRDNDVIAVGLSGGKDSSALLLILHPVIRHWKNVSLVAITVDEGIAGYRNDTIGSAERLAAELRVRHVVVAFRDLFGRDLDALLKGKEERACTVCGILRRKALASAAEEAGATRIATGHNLDDEAQSVLMNTLRGDLPRLIRESSGETGLFIPRIKPLMDVSEKEIATYLMIRGAWQDLPECPYTHHALRAEVRSMLAELEYHHPGTMRKLMESRKLLSESLDVSELAGPVIRCRQCGEPCSGDLCQLCRLLPTL